MESRRERAVERACGDGSESRIERMCGREVVLRRWRSWGDVAGVGVSIILGEDDARVRRVVEGRGAVEWLDKGGTIGRDTVDQSMGKQEGRTDPHQLFPP
jgi:hypothetical protein